MVTSVSPPIFANLLFTKAPNYNILQGTSPSKISWETASKTFSLAVLTVQKISEDNVYGVV